MDVCPECQIASPHHQQTWQLVARSYPAFASSIFRRAEENERLEQLKYAFMVSIFLLLRPRDKARVLQKVMCALWEEPPAVLPVSVCGKATG